MILEKSRLVCAALFLSACGGSSAKTGLDAAALVDAAFAVDGSRAATDAAMRTPGTATVSNLPGGDLQIADVFGVYDQSSARGYVWISTKPNACALHATSDTGDTEPGTRGLKIELNRKDANGAPTGTVGGTYDLSGATPTDAADIVYNARDANNMFTDRWVAFTKPLVVGTIAIDSNTPTNLKGTFSATLTQDPAFGVSSRDITGSFDATFCRAPLP